MIDQETGIDTESVRKKNRAIMRRSTWLSMGALVALSIVSYFIARNSLMLKVEQPRQNPNSVPPLVLHAFKHFTDGHLEELTALPGIGDEIVFRLATVQPVHTALLAAIDSHEPEVLFKGAKIPPGDNRLLEKEDHAYSYHVRPTDHEIKFCLVYAEDRDHLLAKFKNLQTTWNGLARETCVVLNHDADANR